MGLIKRKCSWICLAVGISNSQFPKDLAKLLAKTGSAFEVRRRLWKWFDENMGIDIGILANSWLWLTKKRLKQVGIARLCNDGNTAWKGQPLDADRKLWTENMWVLSQQFLRLRSFWMVTYLLTHNIRIRIIGPSFERTTTSVRIKLYIFLILKFQKLIALTRPLQDIKTTRHAITNVMLHNVAVWPSRSERASKYIALN